jgi:hypothetical protein
LLPDIFEVAACWFGAVKIVIEVEYPFGHICRKELILGSDDVLIHLLEPMDRLLQLDRVRIHRHEIVYHSIFRARFFLRRKSRAGCPLT